jgi:hypothetical protein
MALILLAFADLSMAGVEPVAPAPQAASGLALPAEHRRDAEPRRHRREVRHLFAQEDGAVIGHDLPHEGRYVDGRPIGNAGQGQGGRYPGRRDAWT